MSPDRNQEWLDSFFTQTWSRYFSDVEPLKVRIVFGRRAKTRLGSIKRVKEGSVITLNGLFKSQAIPEFILLATLVHEITHYAHGFNSHLEQRHRHPHAGGVMRAEFRERGLEDLYLRQRRWLKENWPEVVRANFPPAQRRRKVRRAPVPFWLRGL